MQLPCHAVLPPLDMLAVAYILHASCLAPACSLPLQIAAQIPLPILYLPVPGLMGYLAFPHPHPDILLNFDPQDKLMQVGASGDFHWHSMLVAVQSGVPAAAQSASTAAGSCRPIGTVTWCPPRGWSLTPTSLLPASQVARFAIGLVLIASYPVVHFPARAAVRELLHQLAGSGKIGGTLADGGGGQFAVVEALCFFGATLALALSCTDLG